MKYRIITKIIWCIFTIFIFVGFFIQIVKAKDPVLTNAAQGLEISPTLLDLNAVRGGVYDLNISIRNVTASDVKYYSEINDFTAADESGSPLITSNSGLPDTISIQKWVSLLPDFDLGSRQSKVVTASITIPNNAEPGGHYGVIRFSDKAPNTGSNNVSISTSVGVLVLIRVAGDIMENAELESLYTTKDNNQTSFFENGPITLVTRIKNNGNVHIKPTGSIVIKDMFGGTISTLNVNSEKSNVLPNSIRRFEVVHNSKWMIGKYSANLAISYGTTGQVIIGSTSFWVIPYKLISTGLLLLITVIFILIRLIKVYNRHIIAKSKNEKTDRKKKNSH